MLRLLPFALFVIFTFMKVDGYIDWSWWWIASPIWIPFALLILLQIVLIAIERKYRE